MKTDMDLTKMLLIADKDFKAAIIYMLKDIKEHMLILSK